MFKIVVQDPLGTVYLVNIMLRQKLWHTFFTFFYLFIYLFIHFFLWKYIDDLEDE